MSVAKTEKKLRERTGIASLPRFEELIREMIVRLDLDLSGLIVLTEAASGNHVCTPLIAAMAKAKRVIAVTKDSEYGRAKDVVVNTLSLAEYFGLRRGTILIKKTAQHGLVEKADIITNLGFVRPINKSLISKIKKTAVIPLMYETWEYREDDLDLNECWKRGIPVLGTNEEHEALRISDYVGHLCLKQLFEAQIEVLRSRIVLVSNNRFGAIIAKTLSAAGAEVLRVENAGKRESRESCEVNIGSRLNETAVQDKIRNCDAVVVNTYPCSGAAIGEGSGISAKMFKELAPGAVVIQLYGFVDRESLDKVGVAVLPRKVPRPGHMGWTLADLGPKPVIALHSGGLKVGELLAKARLEGSDHVQAEFHALRYGIGDDFSREQREEFS